MRRIDLDHTFPLVPLGTPITAKIRPPMLPSVRSENKKLYENCLSTCPVASELEETVELGLIIVLNVVFVVIVDNVVIVEFTTETTEIKVYDY